MEDDFEKLMVQQFKNDPEYMKQIIMDEFDEYQKTDDIKPLMHVLKYAIKANGYTNMANNCDITRDAIYKITNCVNEPKISTFKKIFNYLGFNLSLNSNIKYNNAN